MAPNGNSLGLDAEDEEQARTHEHVGYDPELDDEYDAGPGGERPLTRDEAESEEEPDRLAGYASVPPSEFGDAPANANANADLNADAEADADENADEHESVDAYRLGSPIPGQSNSGPVLVVPESTDDTEPALEHESELEPEANYRQEPQIVGAAAEDFDDDGRDEVDGRAEFDQAVGAEEVAGYDDNAASYELAEETAAQSQPAAQVGDTGTQPLLSAETQEELLQRWTAIQVSFVDNPAESVRSAEALIGDIGTAIQQAIQARADQISGSWQGSTDTEQLRLSLQEYRSFLGVVLPK